MENIFLNLLNMSITASWVCLAVFILRIILKRAPKYIRGIMWAFVGIRLICPFSFQSVLSLIPSTQTLPENITYTAQPAIQSGVSSVDSSVNKVLLENFGQSMYSANPLQIISFIAARVWIIGIAAMLIYAAVSYIRIRLRVREAAVISGNIYACDKVDTPFILGVFRPRIFLPSAMDKESAQYVTAHEKAHIKRGDHIWKPIGFLLLAVYWFNPILWLAYILLCRDIELACDEKVIKQLGSAVKKPYSEALINCSVPRRTIAACPLAFGEVGVKSRIKSVLNYKKPAFWVVLVSVITCIALAVCFLTDPVGKKITQIDEGMTFKELLKDVKILKVISNDNGFITEDETEIQRIVDVLQQIEISKKKISLSRTEDRDMTHRIVINNGNTLCFSKDFSEYWVYTGVKPTFSYRCLTPEIAKKAFANVPADNIKGEFEFSIGESDLDNIILTVREINLKAKRPYIEIEWQNNRDQDLIYGEEFYILRVLDGDFADCRITHNYFWNEIAMLLPAHSSSTHKYYIGDMLLNRSGNYVIKTYVHLQQQPDTNGVAPTPIKKIVYLEFKIK